MKTKTKAEPMPTERISVEYWDHFSISPTASGSDSLRGGGMSSFNISFSTLGAQRFDTRSALYRAVAATLTAAADKMEARAP